MNRLWTTKKWLTSLLLAALPGAAWAGGDPTLGAAAPSPAAITVNVPAGARIWFDGHETAQTGAERAFASPPLPPGREFTYQVRVQWRDGERVVERTRRLVVRAGDHIGLNYTGNGSVEVRAASDEAPAASPPVIRYVPVYYPLPASAPVSAPAVPRLYDPGRPAGPPGSNNPLSLGVGNG
jgi:uncharacterized protein (TIGR03000 family)